MKRRGSTGWKVARGQQGLASIIIVATLAIIISLIAIGSVRVSNRNLNSSVSSQVGTNADYAVESGLNQVIKQIGGVPPAGSQATCAAGLTKYFTTPNQYLSTSQDTQITCALVDANPPTILEGNIGYGSDKLIKLQANNGASNYTPSSVLFSWRYTQNPSTPVSIRYAGAAPLKAAYTELKWNNLGATPQRPYPPLMQATFYPLTSSGVVLSTIVPKTVYFYPNDGTGLNITNNTYASLNSGQIVNANCKSVTLPSPPTFNYTDLGSYDCNAIVSALPNYLTNGSYMYMRVMPVYHNADVRVEADDLTGTPLNFSSSSQISVDVTAKAGFARKRLQARLGFSATGGNNFLAFTNPDYALRSAGTICKRYDLDASGNVTIPAGDQAFCPGTSSINLTPPSLTFKACIGATCATSPVALQVYSGSKPQLQWTVSGANNPGGCVASVTTGTTDWPNTADDSGTSPTSNKNPVGGTQTVGGATGITGLTGSTHAYILTCTGPGGGTAKTMTITIKAPPTVSLSALLGPSINYGTQNTLSWVTTAGGFKQCVAGRSGAIANSDGDWGTGNYPQNGASPPNIAYGPNSAQKSAIPAISRERFYYITCSGDGTGGTYNGTRVSNAVDITINFPWFQIYPDHNNSNNGSSVTEKYGGRCPAPSNQVCGSIGNVSSSVPGDFCHATDDPSGQHNNWLGGPDGNNGTDADWLTAVQPHSLTLSPSAPPGGNWNPPPDPDNGNNYWFRLVLQCHNFGGHGGADQMLGQSALILATAASQPPPGQNPPPQPGTVGLVLDRWDVGNQIYCDSGHTAGCGGCKEWPTYVPDGAGHQYYICGIGAQLHYSDGSDPSTIACQVLSNGSGVGTFQGGINGYFGQPLGRYSDGAGNSFWSLGYWSADNDTTGYPDPSFFNGDGYSYETIGIHCYSNGGPSVAPLDCSVDVFTQFYFGNPPDPSTPPYQYQNVTCNPFNSW